MKTKVFIMTLLMLSSIVVMAGCLEPKKVKAFAIKGYEQQIDWMITEGRDQTNFVRNGNLLITYRCLYLNENFDTSSKLWIESKTQEMKVLKLRWEHIFEGKPLQNTYTKTGYIDHKRYVNTFPPFVLNKTKEAVFDFNTSMRDKDFKVGDTVEVVIEVEYEVSGKVYTVKDRIPLVVQMRNLPQSMP